MDIASRLIRAVTQTWLRLLAAIVLLAPVMADAACYRYEVGNLWEGGVQTGNTLYEACKKAIDRANVFVAQNRGTYWWDHLNPRGIESDTHQTKCVHDQKWVMGPQAGQMRCTNCDFGSSARVAITCTGPCAYLDGVPSKTIVVRVPALATGEYSACSPDPNANGASCKISGRASMCGGSGSEKYCWIESGKYTGATCAPADVDQQPSTPGASTSTVPGTYSYEPFPNPPPPGKCPGEVNGVTVYVNCSSSASNTTRTQSTPSVTTTTSTTGMTQTTPTQGTQTGVTCEGGKCTVTVTVTQTDTNGAVTTTTSTGTGDQATTCKQFPDAPACDNGSTFTGTCETKFTCGGDAATCAIARAVNESRCLLNASSQVTSEWNSMASGTGTALTTVTKNIGQFNQTNPFSSACPADQTLTVAGRSIVIPLSQACSVLQMMGNVLVAFTLLAATVFVLKGLGGSN